MTVARLRLALVGETMFPPRASFFQRPTSSGNLPVVPGSLPAHGPESDR
jgi:hypothetical protein